ncbi:HlyD family efflux transporter periplasmic adaptor subunit [Novosphingobium decolorationis]|uniref:HlyD family efflux transporter periplasmic adaptor subunit n=1 Tax=Novosphingobium decolorationis TaxID=2698673 RepID=A0ABX8E1E3_9SPHN|nr:HlyD family efflux transporter periplasmic adaptor subunit [Novosphingobium decolorationis]QVM82705.1 HlyD family efflux transporter periplasmic adaptor subunit [Novosphingobium decolorationis]
MKKSVGAALLALVLVALTLFWFLGRGDDRDGVLELHGNVDVRQVSLAFEEAGRLAELNVEEGDTVAAGDIVARLDTETLALQARQAEAELAARRAQLDQLRNGSRPEEIAQAREARRAAQAEAARTRQDLARMQQARAATDGRAVSTQDLDAARSAAEAAAARAGEAGQALTLARKGPRAEQVATAAAQVQAAEAQAALLRHRVEMGVLRAPHRGVVRARLLEEGDMASPQRPVLDLALLSPKWVRVYVGEADLGRVHPGMAAHVTSDSAPDAPVKGQVGYISSVAEFTPKSVETEELRTALVYEVRVIVSDTREALRLGQPVTVRLDIGGQK